MKVLALGGLWIPYIRENWFDSIRHVLGHDALVVNAGPLLVNNELNIRWPEGYHSAYIYELLRREHFDYLFFYHDWIHGSFSDSFFNKVRSAGVRTVAFHPDDEPEHWFARNSAYDHHFDLIASHSREGVARRRATGWGEKVMYLPWGYNPRTRYRLPDIPKSYDVVFIGKYKVSDTISHAPVEDGAQRDQVLTHLAETCEQNGWIFRIFGYGWEKHPILHRYFGGTPSDDEMVLIFNKARIVFNPAWSSDGDPNAVQTKLRHFEVPGCGAFQLTNENPELAELYAPGKEVVFYRTNEELIATVDKFLSDDAARDAVAHAGHARSLREHTLDHRVKSLFSHATTLYPPLQSNQGAQNRVRTIELHDRDELTDLRNSLQSGTYPLDSAEWFHIVGGKFESSRSDYRVLDPFFQHFPDKILTVRTFIDFNGLAANPLQPKPTESDGYILTENVKVKDFSLSPFGDYADHFMGVWSEDSALLLINYIAPRSRLKEMLNLFCSGSIAAIHQLEALPTGRIVTEALISIPLGLDSRRGVIRNFEYVKRLNILLPLLLEQDRKIVVYGITGMGEVTLKLIKQTSGLNIIGVIDRALDTEYYDNIPVLHISELSYLKPDIIILTSGSSGPSIHAAIEYLEAMICILPLYDLGHPAWAVVLP